MSLARLARIDLAVSGGIATISLNDPSTRNALDLVAIHQISDAVSQLAADGTIAALVIRGCGGAFSSGASLTKDAAGNGADTIAAAQRMIHSVISAPFPVISAVDGPSAGVGASLVFASDLAVASERSFFLLPFVGIGLIPDGGATITLSSAVGRARAMQMALLQERISASDAAAWGLVARVCPREGVEQIAQGWATQCAASPRAAIQATKAAINEATFGREGSALGALTGALEREESSQLSFLESAEYEERVSKFLSRQT